MKRKKTDEILKCPENDPMGSYTGVVTSPDGEPVYEKPVQDADDL